MATLKTGVTDGHHDRHVLLEAVYPIFEGIGNRRRPVKTRKCLYQLMHCPPHDVKIIRDFLSVQALERTYS